MRSRRAGGRSASRRCRSSPRRRSPRSREFGDLNAWLDGEDYTRHGDVNLGIAVSLGAEGLIVPGDPRRAAPRRRGRSAARIADLAARARAGTLSADEVRDGTFTITNPGQFGTLMATPVINQPQVAILDIEAIVKPPGGGDRGRQRVGRDPLDLRPRPLLGSPRPGRRSTPLSSWRRCGTGSRRRPSRRRRRSRGRTCGRGGRPRASAAAAGAPRIPGFLNSSNSASQTAQTTSRPTKSHSARGPIGCPQPSVMPPSMSSRVANPSSSIRTAATR